MNQELNNPFTPESEKPKRSLTEVFRGGKKELGEDDVEKALEEAIQVAEKKVFNRESKADLREEIEVTFEQEVSDIAFECIESFVQNGVTDLEKTFVLKDGELYSINSDVITSPEGLILPPSLEGYISLPELNDAKGLKFPPVIQSLVLPKVRSIEGVNLPSFIPVEFSLGIEALEGVKIPDFVSHLNLPNLKSAIGLEYPSSVYSLFLDSLTSVEGLEFSENIKDISLNGLSSAKGVKFPDYLESLYLGGVTSIEGLELPVVLKKVAFFVSLSDEDLEELKKKYPEHAEKLRNSV